MMTYLEGYEDWVNTKKEEYNDIEVYYCKDCLSLRINGEIEYCDYCEECHSGNIEKAHISDWEKLYEAKYGQSFLSQPSKIKRNF